MPQETVLHSPIVLPDRVLPFGEVIIRGDRITAVNAEPTRSHPTQVWEDGWLLPGLVDIHIHGIRGVDVMDGTPEAVATLDQALASVGTTSYLATTMSATVPDLMRVFQALQHYRKASANTGLLGVHMEGPYIHPERIGAQRPDAVRPPSLAELEQFRTVLGDALKRITVAPELSGVEAMISWAEQYGVMLSVGHSNATYAEAEARFEAGIRQVTHLFNAMTGLNHRAPGLVGAALMNPAVQVEMIADGVHLHPEVIRLTHQMKGPDGVLLVTDAMRAAELSDGVYDLGGQAMTVKDGVARTADGHLAGSTLTLLQAVWNYRDFARVDLPEAVRAASLRPARAMGFFDIGAIEPGFRADLIRVDGHGINCTTWRCGQVVYDGA